VQHVHTKGRGRDKGWLFALAATALTSLSLTGCAGFWDEVTSRNFQFSHLYTKPNPFVVLQNSSDGNDRAKALRALREPRENGGTEQDQEAVLKILTTAASKEKQFLCRMAAIESLGRFKDPRAVDGLTEAFYSSGSFPLDLATRMQMHVATALGRTRQPAAEQFLIKIAQEKPRGEGSEQEKQQILDVRIAATRALGNFNDPKATEVLQAVLHNEKDVALRDSARDSIELASGKKSWLDTILPAKHSDYDASPAPSNAVIPAKATEPAPVAQPAKAIVPADASNPTAPPDQTNRPKSSNLF
jgi:hypothetical protein